MGDGRYLVLSTGVRRFALDGLVAGAGTAYLTGEVTFLEEGTGDADAVHDLAERLRSALHDYATTLGATEPDWPADAEELSYAVGTAVGLDLGDRQRLLAAADTETRLRLGLTLVRRERSWPRPWAWCPRRPSTGSTPTRSVGSRWRENPLAPDRWVRQGSAHDTHRSATEPGTNGPRWSRSSTTSATPRRQM